MATQSRPTAAQKREAKKEAENRRQPTDPAAPVVDRDEIPSGLVVTGHELRVGVEEPKQTKARETRETKAFAAPTTVDVLEVAGDTQHIVVRFDNQSFALDAQQALALSRLVDGAKINLNV